MLIVLFISLFLVAVSGIDLYNVSRSGTVVASGIHCYFVYDGKRHELPDRYTMYAYGFWVVPKTHVSYHSLTDGEPIDSMWHPNVPNKVMLDILHDQDYVHLLKHRQSRLDGFANAGFFYRPTQQDWFIKIAHKPAGSSYNQFLGRDRFRIVYVSKDTANSTALHNDLDKATQWMEDNLEDWSSKHPSVPYIGT